MLAGIRVAVGECKQKSEQSHILRGYALALQRRYRKRTIECDAAGQEMPLPRPTACGYMINAPKAGRCEYQRKIGTLHSNVIRCLLCFQKKLLKYKTIQSTICNIFFKKIFPNNIPQRVSRGYCLELLVSIGSFPVLTDAIMREAAINICVADTAIRKNLRKLATGAACLHDGRAASSDSLRIPLNYPL